MSGDDGIPDEFDLRKTCGKDLVSIDNRKSWTIYKHFRVFFGSSDSQIQAANSSAARFFIFRGMFVPSLIPITNCFFLRRVNYVTFSLQ